LATHPLSVKRTVPCSLYREGNGTVFLCTEPTTEREQTMPGIDFDKLRREITMEEVLNLLDFEPTQ
jgi:hypothetical protein